MSYVKAFTVIVKAKERGFWLATAESCTGGLVAAALTDVPGSSAAFDRGFVTYSNAAKTEMLGVPAALIGAHGAVSAETARAMAQGALARSGVDVALSVTGIAGPSGGSVDKPVGLVHFGCLRHGGEILHVERRFGALSRDAIRRAAVDQALDLLLAAIEN